MDAIKTIKRMKSIKKKSQEWADMYPSCGMANKSFTEGANYVLEQIERIVNSAIENKSMTIPTWRLNYIIKQLKK